tara:strand:- start:40 stop:318 length:279 start_codon:yes stop_codon:yes gene_type:complete
LKIKTYKLTIYGKVQGVWYRGWFLKQANKLNIKGYVKNLKMDNLVEALIQGNSESIKELTKLSKVGPKLAKVDKILINEKFDSQEYKIFQIE